MIFSFINEEIQNPSLSNEYTKRYSDLPENDFIKIVKLDADSYPGKDISQEPNRVGQLAGGNGLLIKAWRNNDRDWLTDEKTCSDILKATVEFYKNRASMPIKNPGQFKNVQEFLDMVLKGAQVQANETPKETEEEKVAAKIEKFRLSQFPGIDAQTFNKLVALDPESIPEKGIIGDSVRNLLCPLYLNILKEKENQEQELDLLFNKPLIIKKIIYALETVDNQSLEKIKKNLNSVTGLIANLFGSKVENSHFLNLLQEIPEEGNYKILGSTADYDVTVAYSMLATTRIDCCIAPLNTLGNLNSANHCSYYINHWCTGWNSSYLNQYTKDCNGVLVQFINRADPKDVTRNYQISMKPDGYTRCLCNAVERTVPDTELAGVLKRYPDVARILFNADRDLFGDRFASNPVYADVIAYHKQKGFDVYSRPNQMLDIENLNKACKPYVYNEEEYHNLSSDDKLNLMSLIIPEGIEEFPAGEFENLINLIEVKFPSSLKVISSRAFANCKGLRTINLPPNLEIIKMGAFANCISLRGSIALPLSIKEIQPYAFENHNKKGISFTLPIEFFNQKKKLIVPQDSPDEEEANWWNTKGRFKIVR